MNKKLLFLTFLATLLASASFVLAQSIASMAEAIADQIITVGQAIVIIMWVVTGVLYLTCLGDPGKLKAANTSLFAAIGGTILVILARAALGFVARSFGLVQ